MDRMSSRHLPTRHLPMTRAELDARGDRRAGRRLRHGRRLRRPPVVRHGHPRARGSSRRGYRVAILAQPDWRSADAVARARPAAALLRRQRRQHGLDDQPLHGEPEARGTTTPTRPAAAPGCGPTGRRPSTPALPRGVPGRARDRGRRRGLAAPHRALRLLVRHGAAVDPRARARPTCSCYGMGERADPRDRRPARRGRGRRSAARPARRRLPARARARRRPPTPSSCRLRGRSPPRSRPSTATSAPSREATRDDPPRDEPAERAPPDRSATATACVVREPAGAAARRARRWTRSTTCPYTRTPHPRYTEADPRRRR